MSTQALQLAPALPLPETWLPYADALRLCDRTQQWFSLQIRSGNIRVRETERVQRNGRPEREVALASLPTAAQQRWQREQQPAPAAAVQAALPLFGAPQLVRPGAPRVRVAPQRTPEAERRQQILEPVLALQDPFARRIYAAGVPQPDGSVLKIESQNQMVAHVVAEQRRQGNQITTRTVLRWLAAHKAEGRAGLQRKKRADAGQSRWFQRHPKAAALVAYLYLGDGISPGLSAQACYEMLLAQRELCDVADDDLPCPDTVRNFVHGASKALAMYCRKGREEFAAAMLPYLSRGYTEPANWCWISDHEVEDVELMNDCVPGAEIGAPVRLRLSAIIDYRSRYVVGYCFAWEGSSYSIAHAMRHAVLAHGPCELFYADNGKDYLKVAKGAVPGYLRRGGHEAADWHERELKRIVDTGICARLGMQVTHCLVRHPQSKHVERFFGRKHEQFDKLWQTYTGGKPGLRPDNTAALMAQHRKAFRKKDLTQSHHPLASEYVRAFANWLEIYHHTPHGGEGMDGRTPAQVFAEERNPNQRPAPSPADLAVLLWDYKTATVNECQLTINKVRYVPTDAAASHTMLHLNRTRVVVAYDPLSPDCVAVLDTSATRVVAMLERKVLARMAPDDPETQAQVAGIAKQRGTLLRGLRETHLSIVKGGKQLGVVHPRHLLTTGGDADAEVAGRVTPRRPRPEKISAATKAPMYANDVGARMFARMLQKTNPKNGTTSKRP